MRLLATATLRTSTTAASVDATAALSRSLSCPSTLPYILHPSSQQSSPTLPLFLRERKRAPPAIVTASTAATSSSFFVVGFFLYFLLLLSLSKWFPFLFRLLSLSLSLFLSLSLSRSLSLSLYVSISGVGLESADSLFVLSAR
jgi:hypothetical protein